jgi:hypothetical protein
MTTTEVPATGRGRPTTADRVPIPTRQRRPGLAALAIVLILGGAALSGYIAITSGEKKGVVVLARDVPDGQVITAADLTTIDVSAPNVETIPAAQLGEVANRGYRAQGRYPKGTILVPGMLAGRAIPGDNYVSMAVIVPEGQFPPQTITPGSAVKVLYTPKGNSGADADGKPTIATLVAGAALIDQAKVVGAKAGNSGGGIFIIIVPNNQSLSLVALANAAGAITLVKLPDNVRPATGPGQS